MNVVDPRFRRISRTISVLKVTRSTLPRRSGLSLFSPTPLPPCSRATSTLHFAYETQRFCCIELESSVLSPVEARRRLRYLALFPSRSTAPWEHNSSKGGKFSRSFEIQIGVSNFDFNP